MAPKTHYDAAEMQAKANEVAEKEIRILAREGVELEVEVDRGCCVVVDCECVVIVVASVRARVYALV